MANAPVMPKCHSGSGPAPESSNHICLPFLLTAWRVLPSKAARKESSATPSPITCNVLESPIGAERSTAARHGTFSSKRPSRGPPPLSLVSTSTISAPRQQSSTILLAPSTCVGGGRRMTASDFSAACDPRSQQKQPWMSLAWRRARGDLCGKRRQRTSGSSGMVLGVQPRGAVGAGKAEGEVSAKIPETSTTAGGARRPLQKGENGGKTEKRRAQRFSCSISIVAVRRRKGDHEILTLATSDGLLLLRGPSSSGAQTSGGAIGAARFFQERRGRVWARKAFCGAASVGSSRPGDTTWF
eukprot:scaffold246_cov242-Pinguiococcus_pyrenoidosus.AAC.12